MGVLEGLKRRLLGGSNRGARRDGAGQVRSADLAVPASSAASFGERRANVPLTEQPAMRDASSCSHLSPLTAALELPSPRRIPLGGLPSQLAALQQCFAGLPQHTRQHMNSRAALAARLAAARHGGATAHAVGKAPAKAAASRSPRKGAVRAGKTALRRPVYRSSAALRRQGSGTAANAASVSAKQIANAALTAGQSPALVPAAGPMLRRSKRSKLAHLKQRQALRSADGSRPATGVASPHQGSFSQPAAPDSSCASSAANLEAGVSVDSWTRDVSCTQSEAAEAATQAGRWEAASLQQQGSWVSQTADAECKGEEQTAPGKQHPPPKLTQRVLAGAARRAPGPDLPAQPQSKRDMVGSTPALRTATVLPVQCIASSSSDSRHHSRHGRKSSHSELGLTLAPWAGEASQRLSSDAAQGGMIHPGAARPPLLGWVQSADAAAVPLAAAAQQARVPALQPTRPAQPEEEVPDRLPAHSPSSAAERQRLSARHELPPDLLSLQDSASLARSRSVATGLQPLSHRRARSMHEAGRKALAAGPSAAGPLNAATAGAASNQAAGVGRGAGQLPALGRQRWPGWNSDFAGVVPGWQPPGQELHLPGAPGRPKDQSSAAQAADSAPQPADRQPTQEAAEPARAPVEQSLQQQQQQQQQEQLRVEQQQQQQQPAIQLRQTGVTKAQQRQEEAWGSLAGLTLEQMLRHPPARALPPANELCSGHENDATGFDSSSSKALRLQGSPRQDETSLSNSPVASRQGRRRTSPNPCPPNSLEQPVQIYRARSDNEQQAGSTPWHLPPAARLPAATGDEQQRLPPLRRASSLMHTAAGSAGTAGASTAAVQIHELRGHLGTSFLANLRQRGSWKHNQEPLDAPASACQQHEVVQVADCEKPSPASVSTSIAKVLAEAEQQCQQQGAAGQEAQQPEAGGGAAALQAHRAAPQGPPSAAAGQHGSLPGLQQVGQAEASSPQQPAVQQQSQQAAGDLAWHHAAWGQASAQPAPESMGTETYSPHASQVLASQSAYLAGHWSQAGQQAAATLVAATPARATAAPAHQMAQRTLQSAAQHPNVYASAQHGVGGAHAQRAVPAGGLTAAWWQPQQQAVQACQHPAGQQAAWAQHQHAAAQQAAWQAQQWAHWQQQQQQQQQQAPVQYLAASGRRRWQVPSKAAYAPQLQPVSGQVQSAAPWSQQAFAVQHSRASLAMAHPAYWPAYGGSAQQQAMPAGAYLSAWPQQQDQQMRYQAAYGSAATRPQHLAQGSVLPQLGRH
ncbi:hypothetical protein ABPG77_006647 [Micractinium sp. CCAP 211/92]